MMNDEVLQVRDEPRELEDGTYWKYTSPRGNVTLWLLVAARTAVPGDCRIQLLYSDEHRQNHMPVGGTSIYPRETLQFYKLWQSISEEDFALEMLGALP